MTATQVEAYDADSLALKQLFEEEKKQETVEEFKQEIAPTQSKSKEEEKKAEILDDGQIDSRHKPVFRRYDVGNVYTFEFGL